MLLLVLGAPGGARGGVRQFRDECIGFLPGRKPTQCSRLATSSEFGCPGCRADRKVLCMLACRGRLIGLCCTRLSRWRSSLRSSVCSPSSLRCLTVEPVCVNSVAQSIGLRNYFRCSTQRCQPHVRAMPLSQVTENTPNHALF